MQVRCGWFVRVSLAAVILVATVAVTTGAVPVPAAGPDAPGAAPPASAQTWGVTGIDIASWQHPTGQPIDWGAVRRAGHAFAFIKATEGASSPGGGRYTNPWFAQDWVGAGAAGLYRGAYHYAQPTANPADAIGDARHFVRVTGTMNGALDLPPVFDLEEHNGLAPAQVAAWSSAWLGEVQRLTGRQPMIYTGPWFWDRYVNSAAFGGYPLWIASYGVSADTVARQIPRGWSSWTIWQWTSSGTVPGIVGPVDLNRFCCSLGTLAGLAAGSGQLAGNPFGNFEGATRLPGGSVEVGGWTIDPDTVAPIGVHVYADGRYVGQSVASVPRPDVGRAYPQYGDAHGFRATVSVPLTARQVCVYAINSGPGNLNPLLGCRTPRSDPLGVFGSATLVDDRQVRLRGWAVDPDSNNPVELHVYVNGRFRASVRADAPRPSVPAAYPGAGPNHGLDTQLRLREGSRTICVYAINVGPGTTNPNLGCRTVVVPGPSPLGNLEAAEALPGAVAVSGWAADPDAGGPVEVRFSVDGVAAGTTTTDAPRSDVTRSYAFATDPAFAATLSVVGSGPRTVCATAVNANAGESRSLGCRQVSLGANPIGNVDSATLAPGQVQVQGWALDPDTAGPIDVHVYVYDAGTPVDSAPTVANVVRFDVWQAYPAFGAFHGFDLTIAGLAPGERRVCAYAINVGPGSDNPLLGCRDVVITAPPA